MKAEPPGPTAYIRIRCHIPPMLEEELPELLAPWSVLGTEVDEGDDCGVPVAVFLREADTDGAEGVSRVLRNHGAQGVTQGVFLGEDWMTGFRDLVRPFEVGCSWWVDPHPDRPTPAPEGRRRLAIEPRMAFGSGSHDSTRAILETIEGMDLIGRRVLDVGTGSGILAFAAECLGAETVVGLDIDPAAVWIAWQTARQQEWPSHAAFVLGPVGCLGGAGFDIALCNMIASDLLSISGELRKLLVSGGVIVFSGLLATEVDSVTRSLDSLGLEVESRRALGDWASVTARVAGV